MVHALYRSWNGTGDDAWIVLRSAACLMRRSSRPADRSTHRPVIEPSEETPMKMNRCWCVTEHGRPLSLFEQPMPQPAGNEVLVRITAAGVCHSDVHLWDGYYDLGNGNKLSLADRGMQVADHDRATRIAGEIVAVGAAGRCQPRRAIGAGLSVAGLRHLPDLPPRRGEPVHQGPLAGRVPAGRLSSSS
jgi:hypothetical protein